MLPETRHTRQRVKARVPVGSPLAPASLRLPRWWIVTSFLEEPNGVGRRRACGLGPSVRVWVARLRVSAAVHAEGRTPKCQVVGTPAASSRRVPRQQASSLHKAASRSARNALVERYGTSGATPQGLLVAAVPMRRSTRIVDRSRTGRLVVATSGGVQQVSHRSSSVGLVRRRPGPTPASGRLPNSPGFKSDALRSHRCALRPSHRHSRHKASARYRRVVQPCMAQVQVVVLHSAKRAHRTASLRTERPACEQSGHVLRTERPAHARSWRATLGGPRTVSQLSRTPVR